LHRRSKRSFSWITYATSGVFNGPILIECKTLKYVVASAAEAETGGLFLNGQTAVIIKIILEALNHKQPPTQLKTDNSTSSGFANSHIRIKRAKSWDMRYNWLRCRENQQQLNIYWEKGKATKLTTSRNILPRNIIKNEEAFFHVANHIVTSLSTTLQQTLCKSP